MFTPHHDRVQGRADTPFATVVGTVVGLRRCTMEGCRGTRVGVRWPDGKLTWPCSKGLEAVAAGQYRIL